MFNPSRIHLFLACSLFLSLSTLFSQTTGSGDSLLNFLTQQSRLGLNFTQGFEYDFPSDAHSPGAGDVSVLRLNSSLTYTENYELGYFRVGGLYEYADYDWSSTNYFHDINSIGLNGFANFRFDESSEWGIFGLTNLKWSAEDGASFSDGFSYMVGIGPSYEWSEDLSFGLGLSVMGSPDRALRFLPIPILNWNFLESWNLRLANGATITYDMFGDRSTRFDFSAQYDSSTFAINGALPAGRSGNNVVSEQSVVLIGGVTQKLGGPFFVRGYIQGTVYREYDFRAEGNRYLNFKTDPSVALGIQVIANF